MVACSSSMALCRYWYRSSFRVACSTPALNSRRTFNMGLASLLHLFSGLELQEELGLAAALDRLQIELRHRGLLIQHLGRRRRQRGLPLERQAVLAGV